MANTKISALTSLAAVPATGDLFSIVDISDTTQAASGTTKKIAASFFAFLGQANVFTAASNTFQGSVGVSPTPTNALGVNIVMPSSTSVSAIKIEYINSQRIYLNATAGATQVGLESADYGATIGPSVLIGHNSNAASAAGNLRMKNKGGTEYFVWVDTLGKLRIGTTAPTSANDATGAIVGTQS